jgi:hypothetical protein
VYTSPLIDGATTAEEGYNKIKDLWLRTAVYTVNQVTITNTLMNDGGGAVGVGTVTSVSSTLATTGADVSLSVSNPTTTPSVNLSIPTASAAARGVLSAADWSAFNAKGEPWTLTTTGTSGVATYAANVLNVPDYGAATPAALALHDLTDVQPTLGTVAGSALVYDSGLGLWVAVPSQASTVNLGATQFNIGQVLKDITFSGAGRVASLRAIYPGTGIDISSDANYITVTNTKPGVTTFDELLDTDVQTAAPVLGSGLAFNGTHWVPSAQTVAQAGQWAGVSVTSGAELSITDTGVVSLSTTDAGAQIGLSTGDGDIVIAPDVAHLIQGPNTATAYATLLGASGTNPQAIPNKKYVDDAVAAVPGGGVTTYDALTDVDATGKADGSMTNWNVTSTKYEPVNEIRVLPTSRNVSINTTGTADFRSDGALTIQTSSSAPVTITANGAVTGVLTLDAENEIIGTAVNDVNFTSSAGAAKLVSTTASASINAGTNVLLNPQGTTPASLVKINAGTRTATQYATDVTGVDDGVPNVKYVANQVSTRLPLAGGTLTGPLITTSTINAGANKITSSATPSVAADLTNKAYVDLGIANRTYSLDALTDVAVLTNSSAAYETIVADTTNILYRYRAQDLVANNLQVVTALTPNYTIDPLVSNGLRTNDGTFLSSPGINGLTSIQTPYTSYTNATASATLSFAVTLPSITQKTFIFAFSNAASTTFQMNRITPANTGGIYTNKQGFVGQFGLRNAGFPFGATNTEIKIYAIRTYSNGAGAVSAQACLFTKANTNTTNFVDLGSSGTSEMPIQECLNCDRIYLQADFGNTWKWYELIITNDYKSDAQIKALVNAMWQRYNPDPIVLQAFNVLKANANGNIWSNGFANMSELGDATISLPSANQLIKYVGTKWVNTSTIADTTTISNVTDATKLARFDASLLTTAQPAKVYTLPNFSGTLRLQEMSLYGDCLFENYAAPAVFGTSPILTPTLLNAVTAIITPIPTNGLQFTHNSAGRLTFVPIIAGAAWTFRVSLAVAGNPANNGRIFQVGLYKNATTTTNVAVTPNTQILATGTAVTGSSMQHNFLSTNQPEDVYTSTSISMVSGEYIEAFVTQMAGGNSAFNLQKLLIQIEPLYRTT